MIRKKKRAKNLREDQDLRVEKNIKRRSGKTEKEIKDRVKIDSGEEKEENSEEEETKIMKGDGETTKTLGKIAKISSLIMKILKDRKMMKVLERMMRRVCGIVSKCRKIIKIKASRTKTSY